ncbi:hypothetical protein BKG82_12695 [Mycobacteroides chelonae]|uniref:Uncharacterized protein n=1 Tax=Mycobacteroides chelonae TaxID=1774 RepID=A0A1S1LP20_MYCCH|nr:hypothetical protein [Mycobacteroides chelonae]OHU57045.1 hypothetical protein BKG82_12695 [Mycobacteroides chelonae]
MTTTGTLVPAAQRRAELLICRYTALTESNPGFHYHLHMSACEEGVPDTNSVTAALVAGRERFADLVRLAADDHTFQLWRLRLEHPGWWIGGRVRGTTELLAELVRELSGTVSAPYQGFHRGATGYIGAHWFTSTLEAIAPLAQPTRIKLAEALSRELLGRDICRALPAYLAVNSGGQEDIAEAFPEAEFDAVVDSAGLEECVNAAEAIHGPQWAGMFRTMLGELDPLTWDLVAEALIIEVQDAR